MSIEDLLKDIYQQGLSGGENETFENYKSVLMNYGISAYTIYDILSMGYSNSELYHYGVYVEEPDFKDYIPEQVRYIQVI